FSFDAGQIAQMSGYLEGFSGRSLVSAMLGHIRRLALAYVIKDTAYAALQDGTEATMGILSACRELFGRLAADEDSPYREEILLARSIVGDKRFGWMGPMAGWEGGAAKEGSLKNRLSFFRFVRLDHLLRHGLRQQLEKLMTILYHLDVCVAVAKVAGEKGFTYATALPRQANLFYAEGLSHPVLPNAVGNTISFNEGSNLLFLTGANMAGKSTLMKSFGIALYLAHMGFPVAAARMEFSTKDGMFTSINVTDSLVQGYSHFYSEVLRVKKVAEEVSGSKEIVVIFDELFKGTNVKDAFDATLAVTEAFCAYRTCFFMISTHIIEVGEALLGNCANIRFARLGTMMEGTTPRYTYSLEEGITADRHGMIIIENEGILHILAQEENEGHYRTHERPGSEKPSTDKSERI